MTISASKETSTCHGKIHNEIYLIGVVSRIERVREIIRMWEKEGNKLAIILILIKCIHILLFYVCQIFKKKYQIVHSTNLILSSHQHSFIII